MGNSTSNSTLHVSNAVSIATVITGAELNGKMIQGTQTDEYVDDCEGDIITFYHVRPYTDHGFIVCRTDRDEVFRCDLIGDHNGVIRIYVLKTSWMPSDHKTYTIYHKPKSISSLKSKVKYLIQSFGAY